MPQRCSICIHPKRRSIDRMLLNPKRLLREISGRFSVSVSALDRHKAHIVRAVTTAKRAGAVKVGKTAHEQFEEMVAEAEKKYREAKGSVQVAWFREWRGMLELAFKLGLAARLTEEVHTYRDVTPAVAALIEGLTADDGGGDHEDTWDGAHLSRPALRGDRQPATAAAETCR